LRAVSSYQATEDSQGGATHEDLLHRLRRMEGQVRGVQRMVEQGRGCVPIVHQLSAIRSAAYSAGLLVLKEYARECAPGPSAPETAPAIDDLIDVLLSYPG
jgi:CsoR family transcriptional regulator, copper-sensing transcriptional repressor